MPEILGTSKSIYGFDPRSIGGCLLWLDGADATTLYANSGGTVLSTVGGQVQLWTDKSGQGNNFSNRSANTSVYYPTYVSGGGVFITNAGSPYYNSSTYMCLQSVTNFLAYPYCTVYSVVKPTNANALPTIFQSQRDPTKVSTSPQFGCGGSFSLGSNYAGGYATSRYSVGEYTGVSGSGGVTEQAQANIVTVMGLTSGRVINTTSVAGVRTTSCGSLTYVPYTTCGAPPMIGGSIYIYNTGAADNRWFNGTVYETLVFNSELTVNQCQEIEGYLSWKWGRQTALPTTHPFYSFAPLARGFTPIDIPGCQLWLDGADTSSASMTFSSGSNISVWKDKSGNARNGTGSNSPVLTPNQQAGLSVVTLASASSQFFDFGNTLNLGKDGLTIFFLGKTTLGSINQSFISKSSDRLLAGRWMLLSVTTSQYLFFGVDPAGAGTSDASTSSTSTSGAFALYTSTMNRTSSNYLYTNGAVAGSVAFSNVTNFSTTDKLYVGAYPDNTGLAPRSGYYYNGTIGEVILYNAGLTNVQRQAVEGYLAQKWGLSASLSTTNSLCKFPPSSVQQFKPTDMNACSLWLDAADLTGSTISTWNDKSGNGSNATANSAITILSNAVNGNNVLSVSSGTPRWLLGNISITGVGLTVISAFKMDSSSSSSARIIGLAATGANDYNWPSYVGIFRQASSNMGAYRNGLYAGPLLTYGVPTISTTYFDGANGYSYINGGTASSFAATANFAISSYAIMANTNTADSQYLTGYMCEMIVYNSTLTLAQRQQVEGYLSEKWAIPLDSTHPYYAINPSHMVGGTGIITPSNLPGLLVWNRADTLAGTNGSTVGTWTNSGNASGPTISCSGTQSNAALNGLNVVNFTTAQTWTSSFALTPTSYTFIQLARQVPGTYARVFQSSVAGTNQLHGYWNSLKGAVYTEGWLTYAGGGVPSEENEWAIITEARVAGGAYECRWNSAILALGTTSSSSNLGGLAINTGGVAAGEVSTCQIAEVILYNSVLTRPQLIGIEEYLRQKWRLGLN